MALRQACRQNAGGNLPVAVHVSLDGGRYTQSTHRALSRRHGHAGLQENPLESSVFQVGSPVTSELSMAGQTRLGATARICASVPVQTTRPRMHASSRVAVRQPSTWVAGCGLDSTADVHARPIQDGRRRIVVSTLLHRRKESVAPLHGSARPALGNTETHVGKQSVNDRARS